MIDWTQISDDEFVEEAERRVNQGQWSPGMPSRVEWTS